MSFLPFPLNISVRKLIAAVIVLLVILLLTITFLYRSVFSQSASINEPVIFEIMPGSSLSAVADDLQQLEYIESAFTFKLLARWRGVQGAIRAGEYEISVGQSAAELLDKIVSGETIQYRVTLVEGWTFKQALEAIWSTENISTQLKDKSPQEISRLMNLDRENPEGLLFPDTYFFTKGETDLDLLARANRRLEQVLNNSWESRLGALPFESPYEALILASIVEKESAVNSERGHVSGVFVRRLESGMRLQSDPTVIYGMGDRYQGNITRSDLQEETDYNTYRISALPPTPIALAGLDSINATLNPLSSDYLYFVSRGDGSHQFSSNLEQHNQAVREFQLQSNGNDGQTDL
jgi:UPF0755 protein